MNPHKPVLRQAERVAFCRACDKAIQKEEYMVSFYSHRNRGMWVHICTSCVEDIHNLLPPKKQLYSDEDLNRNNGVYLQQQEIEKLHGYSDPIYRGREKV